MRVTMIAAAGLVLAGCAKDEPVEVVEAPPPELTRPDCYTVVLFDDPPVVEPDEAVPEPHREFLGSWTRGAWDGKWCTELFVTEIRPDGLVELYEMHAPYPDWGQPASAFKRTARIDDQGDLRFRYGTESLRYRLLDGTLLAERSGRFGKLEAVLVAPDAELPVETAAAVGEDAAAPEAAEQTAKAAAEPGAS
ncbi:MAG TPA: hypothetical protein VMM55_13035 [Thermohalobaculum sp.]|nr:hypothetical protein [Thermohalobaculum sp.]